jgi:hypothetical protein
MSIDTILNLMHKLNKIILCDPMASITLFYATSSINLVIPTKL